MRPLVVHILASHKRGALYVGVTSDLPRRLEQHRNGQADAFTRRCGIKTLVWLEAHDSTESAIRREKRLKRWLGSWKVELIERSNPDWRDLSAEIF
jgi:putative endonuclease